MRSAVVITPALFAIALLFSAADPAAPQRLSAGAEFGANLSTLGGSGARGIDDYRTGLTAGLVLSYQANDLLRIESGVQWVEKGGKGITQGFEEAVATNIRLSYVQIPLLVRVSTANATHVRPSLSFGPVVAFEAGCRIDHAIITTANLSGCEDQGRQTADIGFRLGAGAEWKVAGASLMVEARYEAGLRDLDRGDDLHTRHNSFSLTPRITLPVGRR